MDNLFVIENTACRRIYLEGPASISQERFQALCGSLMESAGFSALTKAKIGSGKFCGSDAVFGQLVLALESHGFRKFTPKTAMAIGEVGADYDEDLNCLNLSIFHQLKNAYKPICEHNKKI